MKSSELSLKSMSQNNDLPIRIVSSDFGHLSAENAVQHVVPSQMEYYFFLFMLDGNCQYGIDSENLSLINNELLFLLPRQIRNFPDKPHGKKYYKLGFDEECISKLPKQYPFLLNPLNQNKVIFQPVAAKRLELVFEILLTLLKTPDTDPELILVHLNSLLTEIDIAYFASANRPANDKLNKFINFKIFVENNLTDHPSIGEIAEELAVSTGSLYQIVKQYSGLSPKGFITNRLILEARRRLYHGEGTSVKTLAFELGFNDPDYFSRLFKKVTGKTVARFFRDLS